MLDQSFTYKNLLKIYDQQNKKGINLEGIFFPSVEYHSERIKQAKLALQQLYKNRSRYSEEVFHERVKRIYRVIRSLKKSKELRIKEELDEISHDILSGEVNFSLNKKTLHGHKKPVYSISSDAASFFAEKQVQSNISKTYHVKQSNRDLIIPQIRSHLQNDFPKYLIKTDIKDFYESVDREILLSKLNRNPLLSLTTRKLLAKLLSSFDGYSSPPGTKKGIPRGIGISAYLAELYMSEFDEKMRKIPDLVYYSRYVDDIIVIFCPSNSSDIHSHFKKIEQFIDQENLELSSEREKTLKLNLSSGGKTYDFNYLGYNFKREKYGLFLNFSEKKELKYRERLQKAFSEYGRKRHRQPRYARTLLLKRVRFLTGNTKLFNNKGSAFIGIYHSNKWINRTNALHRLDRFLEGKISTLHDIKLKKRLYRNSFVQGFQNKTFRKFKPNEMSEIVRVWKL